MFHPTVAVTMETGVSKKMPCYAEGVKLLTVMCTVTLVLYSCQMVSFGLILSLSKAMPLQNNMQT